MCCKSDQNASVYGCGKKGYTLVEIAERLGVGKSLAHEMFTRLRTRILSRLDEP